MKERKIYLDKLIQAQGLDFVKILTGVRRCGKSTLLQLFKIHLINQGTSPTNIIEINFEQHANDFLRDPQAIHEYVSKRCSSPGKYFLFIDEVQEMNFWAKTVNSLRVSCNVDIYVTGSNSQIFSGEDLTYLAGRYLEIPIYPLSYAEYRAFKADIPCDENKMFNEYLRRGAFPAMALVEDVGLINAIATGLFDSIFTRDILLRGRIRDEGNFFKVAKYVFGNIGSKVSANNIANVLRAEGHKISVDAVDNYLSLMVKAYALYQCERFDIRGKERLRTNGKYYVVDLGLRNWLLGQHDSDIGHVLENIVYLELKRRGYRVHVGKMGEREIDFIARQGDELLYVQVAASALSEDVFNREMSSLREINDNYPKLLLTMDTVDLSTEGIMHQNIVSWLKE